MGRCVTIFQLRVQKLMLSSFTPLWVRSAVTLPAAFIRECGSDIYDCTSADLSTSESRRDKFRTWIGYVEDDEGNVNYEAFNVDLLHKIFNGSFDINIVFRGPALHLVASNRFSYAGVDTL